MSWYWVALIAFTVGFIVGWCAILLAVLKRLRMVERLAAEMDARPYLRVTGEPDLRQDLGPIEVGRRWWEDAS